MWRWVARCLLNLIDLSFHHPTSPKIPCLAMCRSFPNSIPKHFETRANRQRSIWNSSSPRKASCSIHAFYLSQLKDSKRPLSWRSRIRFRDTANTNHRIAETPFKCLTLREYCHRYSVAMHEIFPANGSELPIPKKTDRSLRFD